MNTAPVIQSRRIPVTFTSSQEFEQRRRLTPKQRAVAPLTPIFEACRKKGLLITQENCEQRVRAVNRLFNELPGFDWIESFKDLVSDPAAIIIVASEIETGHLHW